MSLDHTGYSDLSALSAISDHALVVHVWHLDVLDDLVEAAVNLPETTDQFVTIPNIFEAAQREQVALAFPRAQLVPVENMGQDVGALFQLMKQVDLGRYDFICKIHTKKGVNPMQVEWRRALLDGVLGSKRQVGHIIDHFRTDPHVMLAGARQLYLHGPSYLDPNAESIVNSFGEMLGDFDIRSVDWGFIGGTCFWIRTAILQDMEQCSPDFKPSEYVTDGTPAHATERMFGISVALRNGKVLLQDVRFPNRLPDLEKSFPQDLPAQHVFLGQLLSALSTGPYLECKGHVRNDGGYPETNKHAQRIAILAIRPNLGLIPDYVEYYAKKLQDIAGHIIIVSNEVLLADEKRKFNSSFTFLEVNSSNIFNSYKCGIEKARDIGVVDTAKAIVFCSDEYFGPVISLQPVFSQMEDRGLDFWGVTDSRQVSPHLQPYFLVLSKKVVASQALAEFFGPQGKPFLFENGPCANEVKLMNCLLAAGFKGDAMLPNRLAGHPKDSTYHNIAVLPIFCLSRGAPFAHIDTLLDPKRNLNGINRLLSWLKSNNAELYESVTSDIGVEYFHAADDVAFSLIMPTRNRAYCIGKAIDSVLCQSHSNFELIVVDDGSSDNTDELLHKKYADELASGKIRYFRSDRNIGVCAARNIGIASARNPWIGYVDSDNEVRNYMLTMFANSIAASPGKECFYSQIFSRAEGRVVGKAYNRISLLQNNYIDLGSYVHSKTIAARCGGFDESLRRLVDWDLIIRHTAESDPVFIPRICMDYENDTRLKDRISVRESVVKALTAVYTKHSQKPTVSTVILSYNHEPFIVDAIESALEQKGDLHHEIVLADDGSTDGTERIIQRYAEKYPMKIRVIGQGKNVGISENYKQSFSDSEGRFIAVLEGDDYWTDPEKNFKQAEFLIANPEAKMVFSRIELLDMKTRALSRLPRQDGLKRLLTGADIAKDANLNPVANFSSAMFCKNAVVNLPDAVFEPRLNEISLCFYMDRIGKIGFIDEVMGVYRLNPTSVWTGAKQESRLRQSIAIRENAIRIARAQYKPVLREHLAMKKRELEKILAPTY